MGFQYLLPWLVVVTGYVTASEQYRNYVPHYEVHTVSEACSLGKSIHDDIDVVFAGIQRIILWSGLQLDPDDYVDIKLNLVQLSSMSALGSYYLMRPFIVSEITKVATNLSDANANRDRIPGDGTARLDKDEFRDLSRMFLMVSAWFRAPCDTGHLVEAVGLLYDIKQAFERDDYDGVRDVMVALTELASSHLPHLQPVVKEPFEPWQETPAPEVHIADSDIVESEDSAARLPPSEGPTVTSRDTIIIPLSDYQQAKLRIHSKSRKNGKKASKRKSKARKHKRHRNRNKHRKSGKNKRHHNASTKNDTIKQSAL